LPGNRHGAQGGHHVCRKGYNKGSCHIRHPSHHGRLLWCWGWQTAGNHGPRITPEGPQERPHPSPRGPVERVRLPRAAVDLRGFGDSEDPPLPLDPGFSFADGVTVAARYALEHKLARPGNIAYLGHSLGAKVILEAAHLSPRPSTVIAIGGGNTRARFLEGGAAWQERFALDRFRDMRLSADEQSVRIMGEYLVDIDVMHQAAAEDLPPLLLVYGARDRSLPTVREQFTSQEERHLLVIPETGHWFDVRTLCLGAVLYNKEILDVLTTGVVDWICSHGGSSATEQH